MRIRYSAGFSLVELLVVVAIIAIIAAVAYPAYTRQVQSTRQSGMQGRLMDFAVTLEAYRAQNFSYEDADVNLTLPTDMYYDLVLNIDADNRGYVLLAQPKGTMTGSGAMGINARGDTCLLATNDTSCDPVTDPGWK